MIQKIFITFFIIILVLFGMRFLKKITSIKKRNNEEDQNIIDLEKDPETDEYRPKD